MRHARSSLRWGIAGLVMLAVAGTAGPAATQVVPSAPANICVTPIGWCHLPSITAPVAVACLCLTSQNTWIGGYSKFYPTTAEPSLYLRPFTTPPAVIK
jgi:hypothetical protein